MPFLAECVLPQTSHDCLVELRPAPAQATFSGLTNRRFVSQDIEVSGVKSLANRRCVSYRFVKHTSLTLNRETCQQTNCILIVVTWSRLGLDKAAILSACALGLGAFDTTIHQAGVWGVLVAAMVPQASIVDRDCINAVKMVCLLEHPIVRKSTLGYSSSRVVSNATKQMTDKCR